ncbi:DUF7344 domain-containing protein [Halorussus salinus]|uniref:DUF7344 domain-containing protein n=1 Tax=Halorussus salinus TaxID=1364935 RepID=UPI0010927D9B|nr:hypothetical protein [Halorussus salinus]
MSRDDIFHLLRNRRRRYALHYLKREEALPIADIAEQVAAWENGVSIEAVSSTQRKHVYNSLQQTHLPKLADSGIIKYQPRNGMAKVTERAERLDVYLEVVPDRDIPWSSYYLGLGAVSLALTSAVWVDAIIISQLPPVAWMTFISVAIVFSAAVNVYYQRDDLLGEHERPPELRGDN